MSHRLVRYAGARPVVHESSAGGTHKDEFSRLLEQHERHVYAYILSLVANRTEAEEILQETYIRLFQKSDDFSGDFRAWACAVARFQVMTYRKKARRERLRFSQEFVDAIAAHRRARSGGPESRAEALGQCVEKLGPTDRQLLNWIYYDGLSAEQAAEKSQRSSAAIYKALSRIRAALHDCIARSLRMREQP